MQIVPELPDYPANLEMQPLCIDVQLVSPLLGYDAVHLDGLLAWARVQQATQGAGLAPSPEPYWLPLPLKCLWKNSLGLPLWASTDFCPVSPNVASAIYIHKRPPRPELVRTKEGRPWNIRRTEGAYKDIRVPLPAQSAKHWRAYAYGNPAVIEGLLSLVACLGKKKQGVVKRWEVSPIDHFSMMDAAGRLMRPVPIAALKGALADMQYIGWTPPYWLFPEMCIPAGAAADVSSLYEYL